MLGNYNAVTISQNVGWLLHMCGVKPDAHEATRITHETTSKLFHSENPISSNKHANKQQLILKVRLNFLEVILTVHIFSFTDGSGFALFYWRQWLCSVHVRINLHRTGCDKAPLFIYCLSEMQCGDWSRLCVNWYWLLLWFSSNFSSKNIIYMINLANN